VVASAPPSDHAHARASTPAAGARRWLVPLSSKRWRGVLVATALGQGIGIAAEGRIDVAALALGLAFAACHIAFVVLLDDFGDREIDRLARRLFPERAPRAIPDGLLEPRSVLYAGAGAGALALGLGVLAQELLSRPGLAVASMACAAIVLARALPPARLGQRGGGELLEMLGLGFALPWWNAYAQGRAASCCCRVGRCCASRPRSSVRSPTPSAIASAASARSPRCSASSRCARPPRA
jgi:hypothetical protein